MKRKMNFNEFTKCDIPYSGIRRGGCFVSLYRSTKRLGFSMELVNQAQLKAGDRIDLYRNGNIWAFKKSAVGCLTVSRHGKGTGLGIGIQAAYYEIGPFVKVDKLEAWVEDGIIYCMEGEYEATGNEE